MECAAASHLYVRSVRPLTAPACLQFVVVKDVLDEQRLAKLRRGCEICIREMVGRDPLRVGNRGSHRYSFGQAPAHFGLQDEWSTMIDPPVLSEVLTEVFGTKDYVCVNGVVGGDYNVPGSVEYRALRPPLPASPSRRC